MKKLFAMLLALSLLLSLSAGFTASAEEILSGVEALFTGEEKVFDPDLVGAWVLDKSEQTNERSCKNITSLLKPIRIKLYHSILRNFVRVFYYL